MVLGVVLADVAALSNEKGSAAIVLIAQDRLCHYLGELMKQEVQFQGIGGQEASSFQ